MLLQMYRRAKQSHTEKRHIERIVDIFTRNACTVLRSKASKL